MCFLVQLGEATLYAASLELMEACIKKLTSMKVFEKQVRNCCSPINQQNTNMLYFL